MGKFPGLAVQIKKLYKGCEEFREICEDYVLCLNAIKKIESTNPAKREEFLNEFGEALEALEDELLSELKKDYTSKIRG
jgi:hypothetical protein